MLHEQALAAGVLVDRDSSAGKRLYPKADALLALVLSGVIEAHPYTFELHVRGASEDNAMALPGGIVYIDAGLVREADPAKAWFALAHEISHVLRRHETRIAQARIIDTISLTGATSDLVTAVREPAAISAGVLTTAAAGHKSFRQHYGDQELQADSCAVRALPPPSCSRGRSRGTQLHRDPAHGRARSGNAAVRRRRCGRKSRGTRQSSGRGHAARSPASDDS